MFVITGGGSGIGRALAHALAQHNQSVLIIGRRKELLEETAQASEAIEILCADVACDGDRQRIASHLDAAPKIQALVHNAGIIEPMRLLRHITVPDWQHFMATNVEGPLFLTQLLQKKLRGGRVLHIGSGAAYFPVVGWAGYCASKAALAMLNRCWQLENTEIAFASVMPGIIDTEMQARIRQSEHMDPQKIAFFQDLNNKQQLITPEAVASFLVWLLVTVTTDRFQDQEWDIYDTSHHGAWLSTPHRIPALE